MNFPLKAIGVFDEKCADLASRMTCLGRTKQFMARTLTENFSLRQETRKIEQSAYFSLTNPCPSRCLAQVSTAEARADELACDS